MTWMLAVLLKPLGVVLFFGLVALAEVLILRAIPDGRIKRLLTKKLY